MPKDSNRQNSSDLPVTEDDHFVFAGNVFSLCTAHAMAEDKFSGGPRATDGLYWLSYEVKTELDAQY